MKIEVGDWCCDADGNVAQITGIDVGHPDMYTYVTNSSVKQTKFIVEITPDNDRVVVVSKNEEVIKLIAQLRKRETNDTL